MPNLGTTELIIILIIVLLVFGVGRVSKIGAELGQGIREFRKGIAEEIEKDDQEKQA
jgi:sec-independent protein translocase protein TatA